MEKRDVVIIGGGAAGLMAAIFAARRGQRPLLIEGARKCGLKILVSGGGRCNVLPSQVDDSDFYTSGSRNVLKRIFRTWPLRQVTEFFRDDLGVELTIEEETGKVFPATQKAATVNDALQDAVFESGGEIRTSLRASAVSHRDGAFIVETEQDDVNASRVILATGGQSLPRTGSDGAGYAFATTLGHTCLDRYPALVPLATDDTALQSLSGIALPVRWRAVLGDRVQEDRVRELLFTHKGFSGPAMLDGSHWSVRDHAAIQVAWQDLSEEQWDDELRRTSDRRVLQMVGRHLPRRLAEVLTKRAGISPHQQLAQLSRDQRKRLIDELCNFELPVSGDLGYGVAEVTGGGIPIGEVNPSTLESRVAPGLYLCGEILDVIGRIGGYNFLWAWVTGRLAGESAAG